MRSTALAQAKKITSLLVIAQPHAGIAPYQHREFHALSKRRKNGSGAGPKIYFSAGGRPQPHAWPTIVSIDEFDPRVFECPADGLIIGAGERGRARHQFGSGVVRLIAECQAFLAVAFLGATPGHHHFGQ